MPRLTLARLPSGLSSTTIANVALLVCGAATGILSSRLLGPHGRGVLQAIWLWPVLLATLGLAGMPEALVFYSASDEAHASRYLTTAVLCAAIPGAVLLVAGYVLMP